MLGPRWSLELGAWSLRGRSSKKGALLGLTNWRWLRVHDDRKALRNCAHRALGPTRFEGDLGLSGNCALFVHRVIHREKNQSLEILKLQLTSNGNQYRTRKGIEINITNDSRYYCYLMMEVLISTTRWLPNLLHNIRH